MSLPESPPDIVGQARNPQTGDTMYLEHHYCTEDRLNCSVFYLKPGNEVFASKQLDYRPDPKAPVLTFRDFRTDRELTIEETGTEQVVDAGFDNFVRLQWQDLEAGDDVIFPFRLVDREKPLTMRASQDKDDCSQGLLCLEVRLNSWLLGSLVDPIELVYDRKSQRLLRFSGISNLKSDEGRAQKVEILYQYRDAPARESNAADSSTGG